MEFYRRFILSKKNDFKAKKSGADAVKFQVWNPEHLKKGNDTDGREIYIRKLFSEKYKLLKNFAKKTQLNVLYLFLIKRGYLW